MLGVVGKGSPSSPGKKKKKKKKKPSIVWYIAYGTELAKYVDRWAGQ